jgi:hypothetical protein
MVPLPVELLEDGLSVLVVPDFIDGFDTGCII